MREIKFRGKSIENKNEVKIGNWVYGFLSYNGNVAYYGDRVDIALKQYEQLQEIGVKFDDEE